MVENAKLALLALAVIWAVFLADWMFSLNLFQDAGIKPRRLVGLWGIPFAPFLHAGWWHILSNSLPLVVLLFVSLTFSRRLTLRALVAIIVLGGFFVWIFGRTGVHGGASGVIFGLIGFLMGAGVFRRSWRSLLVAAIVLIFYGGAIISAVIPRPGISWTGHLFGFGVGAFMAWFTRAGQAA